MDPEPGSLSYAFPLLEIPNWLSVLGGVWIQLILLLLFIVISFMVSGAEVAFFSLSKSQIEEFRKNVTPASQRILWLISRPKILLATILITNNFVNVAAILVATHILRAFAVLYRWDEISWNLLGAQISVQFFIDVILITSLLLFFGEIVPKVFASKNRLRMVNSLALPLIMMRWFFYPVSRVLIRITGFIDKRISLKEDQTSLEDLKHAIDMAANGEEDREEKDILKGIVNFSNIPVKSIMRARVDVIAADINTPLEALIEHINAHNYSRLPIYEENLDHVIGVLHIKDLLPLMRENSEDMNLRDLLRPTHFVPENKKIDALLEEFKSRRLHMAVVADEFGGTAGIVTLEDVIEEIFGEISDEFDSEDWVYTKVSETTYIFEGRISLNDVKKIVDLDEKVFEDARGDSDSLGGLILEIHGKIPTPGEVISYQHFDFHIEAVSKNRIAMVKMIINEVENEHDA